MEANPTPTFIPFPSIGQYRDAVLAVKALTLEGEKLPIVEYSGRVKLHGTNAGLVFDRNGTFHCQSREKIIVPGDDNAGFAKWAHQNVERILDLDVVSRVDLADCGYDFVGIFGEWCGGKISPNVALNQLARMFVVFAVCYQKPDRSWWFYHDLGGFEHPEIGLFNVDLFDTYGLRVDFSDPGAATSRIQLLTTAVENDCPAGRYFGYLGTGEGIVWTAVDPTYHFANFKSKGTKHAAAAAILGAADPAQMQNLSDLIDLIMREGTIESRVEQAVRVLKERGHQMESTKDTKLLVDWLTADIEKEDLVDITASGFAKKKIVGACLARGRDAYKAMLDRF